MTLVAPVSASPQTRAESAAGEARVQVGPLALTPRVSLSDIGVDTNVYNSAEDPLGDFTFAAGPALDSWLRLGRVWVSSESGVEWVHYTEATDQRAFNVKQNVRLDLDLLHVIPHAGAGYERSRRPLNFELDGRLEETRTHAGIGVEFKPGERTSFDLEGVKRRISYGDETFGGVDLSERLNRETEEARLSFRYALTPLTTFVATTGLQRDRFEFDPIRDSDSLRIVPGLEFEPFALISGSVMIGVQQFETRDDEVPDFTGLVAEVDVAYTVRDVVRLTVRSTRDVQYSIEPLEPFFVNSGVEFEVVRVIGLSWDVVARAGRTTLAYQATEDGRLLGHAERTDLVTRYGAGIGRHLGEEIRVGIDIIHTDRRSDRPGRGYSGWRTGGSLTYGF